MAENLKTQLGPWATGRGKEIQMEDGKSVSAPAHPLRQTYSWGVNCGGPAFSFGSVYILKSMSIYSMVLPGYCIKCMTVSILYELIYPSTGNAF